MTIRDMRTGDQTVAIEMMEEFYTSAAVAHPVKLEIHQRTFASIVGRDPLIRGLMLEDDQGVPIGYGIMAFSYSCEMGGRIVMLEELFFRPECRGKGYGKEYINWMFEQYDQLPRLRLEVTEANKDAIRLYERLGFKPLEYLQMVRDCD